jgi:hypothetical protein
LLVFEEEIIDEPVAEEPKIGEESPSEAVEWFEIDWEEDGFK